MNESGTRIRVGTTGWQHPHRRRPFYPETAVPGSLLDHYADAFDTVEVEATYHALVARETIESWRGSVPEGFEFVVDAPRRITGEKKLKGCREELVAMRARLSAFGERLGPVVFRLPARWRCNLRRLQAFLDELPEAGRYCIELRDPSWHTAEVLAALRERGVGLCVRDAHARAALADPPGDLVCVRLHGPVGGPDPGYLRTQELRVWRGRALGWSRRGKDVYVLFDDDDRACAARNARRFLSLLREDGARRAAARPPAG